MRPPVIEVADIPTEEDDHTGVEPSTMPARPCGLRKAATTDIIIIARNFITRVLSLVSSTGRILIMPRRNSVAFTRNLNSDLCRATTMSCPRTTPGRILSACSRRCRMRIIIR